MQLNVCNPTTKLSQQPPPHQPPDYTLKFNEDSYSHIFIPNQDCPLHSTQAIYACKQHMATSGPSSSPQRDPTYIGAGGTVNRHSYGILHPIVDHAAIHDHITVSGTQQQQSNTNQQGGILVEHHTSNNTTSAPSATTPEFDAATLGIKQEEYYQLRANNAANIAAQQQQQPPPPPPDLL